MSAQDSSTGQALTRRDGGASPSCPAQWGVMRTPSTLRLNTLDLTFEGRTQSASEWARELGMKPTTTVHKRLARGWTTEEILGNPQPRRGWRPASLPSQKRRHKRLRRRRGRPKKLVR